MSSTVVAARWPPEPLLKAALATMLPTALIAVPLGALFALSGSVPVLSALTAMAMLALVAVVSGVALLRLAHAGDLPAPAAWVVGAFASACALYLLVEGLAVTAFAAFLIWALCVAGTLVAARRRVVQTALPVPGLTDLVALALCGAATFMWCRDIAEAPQLLARERLLDVWIDHFIHGGVISQFGDPRAVGRGWMDVADFPKPAYHYLSYLLAAVLAAPLDLPGLPLSTSVWLPLGFFTMCCGAYTLGAALAGPAGGFSALAVLVLLPDASNYGLRNGFFSFHWNVLTLPGALYAIGFYTTSMALLHRWASVAQWRRLALSAFLALGMGMVRIHLFALGFPAWLAAVLSQARLVRQRAVLVAALAAVGFTFFVFAVYAITGSAPAFELFLANVHTLQEPTAYRGWYAGLLEASGRAVAVPLGTLAVLAASLGVFLFLYPAALAAAASRRTLTAIDSVPAGLLIFYVLLMMTAPISGHGDSTELTQRPFVLLYAVIAVWSAAVLTDWVRTRLHLTPHLVKGAVVAGIMATLLVWPLAGALARPKFHWGWQHVTYRVDEGLLEAAFYLRRNSRPGDIFAVADLTLHWVATDTATQLESLTGMPAYLARPFTHMFRGNAREREALKRHGLLVQVAAEPQAAAALERLRKLGIRWYVHRGEAGPRWDPGRRDAAFVDRSVAVYRSE